MKIEFDDKGKIKSITGSATVKDIKENGLLKASGWNDEDCTKN